MTILESVIQGIVQGFTEFLPVSSSGHLVLLQHFFSISESDALFFMVMLHMGTLAAVIIAFRKRVWSLIVEFFKLIRDVFTRKYKYSEAMPERKALLMLLITLIPLALCYFISDYIGALSEDYDIILEGLCFLLTGVMLFLACRYSDGTKTAREMTVKDAAIIGGVQCIATLPGVSRSGSTTAAGMLCGLSKEFAIEFSFIMGIPAILGAGASEFLDAYKQGISVDLPVVLIGVATAFVTGLAAIKLVQWLMKTDRYIIFAYYTLSLGSLTLLIGLIERFTGQTIVDFIARF